jgi:peptidoglycan/xylan/chitin deacetylase (PgdA/CDA1 family)
MKSSIFKILRYSGLPALMRLLFQRKYVTILTFHELTPLVAEKFFLYLKKNYNIISLQSFFKVIENKNEYLLPKWSLVITFDDGSISNYSLLNIIVRHKIPVTIFLNSGIINSKRHYWFKYNRELFSNKALKQISNKARLELMGQHGFRQDQEYDYPQALSKDQIIEMSKFIDMQSHTVFHPCLPKCEKAEAEFEIINCKKNLESEYGFDINAIAFPNGDFTPREIEIVKLAGYKYSLTTKNGYNSTFADPFKLKRLDPGHTDNFDEFVVKSSGLQILWQIFKNINLKIRLM